ncbi:AMP-binding protein, partial [Nocardia sp. NPDC058497]|uniref:AMP-binding protein n=1 Tax=Nocardia sp. NPDC058497 TaxID=3346529 RepID=UPI003653A298
MPLWTQIAGRAATHPDEIAFIGTHGQHTYADLLADVQRSVVEIEELSQPGDAVAVRGQRGYGTLTRFLACLAANRVYVPLDDRWPAQRVDLVLAESDASLIVDVDNLDSRTSTVRPTGNGNRRPNLAYIIFTSGSTGVPKGVMIEKDVLDERLRSLVPLLAGTSSIRFVLNTSISFDKSVNELILPFIAGGTNVCPSVF